MQDFIIPIRVLWKFQVMLNLRNREGHKQDICCYTCSEEHNIIQG